MKHIRSLDEFPRGRTYLTVGSFDGVHRGHQGLLSALTQAAHQAGAQSAVVTFFPHPVAVLRGLSQPYYLTSPEERARLMGECGIDVVLTLPFTRELAALSAREFVTLLREKAGMESLWVGYDFALGRNREGDVPTLQRLGEELGFAVHVLPPVALEDTPVSSSLIRAALEQGDVVSAARMLGRPYTIEGAVVHGDARGRTLNIPTINISFWAEQRLPAFGVYACRVEVEGLVLDAVANIGIRPTFANPNGEVRLEAHLLDFSGDLYDRTVRLQFVAFLRPERRFESVEALVAQIQQDIQHAREVLTHAA